MTWHSPEDAMPWVGLYVAAASLICTLAMAADAFQGFRQRKLWFPCRFFTINAASITLIAITMKLPVDLTTKIDIDTDVRSLCITFLFTMLANFHLSLGGMNDKELLVNIIALGILAVTVIVNTGIQEATRTFNSLTPVVVETLIFIFLLLWPFSVALKVPASRSVLEHQYQELHRSDLNRQTINFSSMQLIHHVKKYWMMAETGNPQFVLASSPFSSASGLICSSFVIGSIYLLIVVFSSLSYYWDGKSDYTWSICVILIIQSLGIIVGSIAPISRCITTVSYFNLSREWSINHLNMFRVEKYWTQRLQHRKRNHVRVPGRHCKRLLNHVKNMILNFCIAFQIMLVVISKTICLVPRSLMIIFSLLFYFCNSLFKRFKASNSNTRSEIEEYTSYVLQIEEEEKLSNRMLRNIIRSVTKLVHESEKKQPRNLIKFLEKSTGFSGVVEFDNSQVPPLHPEEARSCWSLVAVTLTAIAVALPNIANGHVKGLLASMSEGLQFVRHIEETLNANGELVKPKNQLDGYGLK